MKQSVLHAARWLAVLVVLALPICFSDEQPDPHFDETSSLSSRLLGPFAELAAQIQWLRVQKAAFEGSPELALVRAESALSLDPSDTEGWRFTAAYLALDLASPNRELDPVRRRTLIRTALDVLQRGEKNARSPGQLALWSGIILLTHAETDPDLDWPGGEEQLWLDAAQAFEHAAELGATDALSLAQMARQRARSISESEE